MRRGRSVPMPLTDEAEAFRRVERAVATYQGRLTNPDDKRAIYELRLWLRGRAEDLYRLAEEVA